MPRVLIVTSMFLPHLAADSHRARLLARELPELGWEVELLVPGGEFHARGREEAHADLLRTAAPVHRAAPEWPALFRLVKSRTLSWRAYRPLRKLGDRLLSQRRFDLVYISCAQVNFYFLGVGWLRRWKTPFVIDLQDPWYSPGLGRPAHLAIWRRRAGNLLAKYMERATLRRAAGLVSVSAQYLEDLKARYAGEDWRSLTPRRQIAVPFGPSVADFHAASELPDPRTSDARDGGRTIVYTGAGGSIMEESFRKLCRLFAEARKRSPKEFAGLKIELYGTEPGAVGQEPRLSRIAAEEGVSDLIDERPARLSYLEALRRVQLADGLLILGVTDPAYNPSKLFLYALSGKPLLACMKSGTTVRTYFESLPNLGRLVQFESGKEGCDPVALREVEAFLEDVSAGRTVERRAMLQNFLAPAMARRHADLFEVCLQPFAEPPPPGAGS